VPTPDDELLVRDAEVAAQALSNRVREILDQLRPDYQEVLLMDARGIHGPAIGEALGISANAARKRLMRARAALRAAFLDSTSSSDVSGARPR
jgi:DNA-directed RNA polymerase specialized sigma24 family protein